MTIPTRSWRLLDGVPTAGHVTASGYWHLGGVDVCPKTPCAEAHSAPPFAVGDAVVYRPRPGMRGEDGVVTGLGAAGLVFVRYADQPPDAYGKATQTRHLERATGARPRGAR